MSASGERHSKSEQFKTKDGRIVKTNNPLDEIIYPEIEPGIINQDMIDNVYYNDDYKGEMLRLHQMEPVVYEEVLKIRLEYKNILEIDHLWILPNLTQLSLVGNKIEVIENLETLVNLKSLDLSFNFIEKIENLDELVNLETLSLFNNLIPKLENLESLVNLVILSLGNNEIDTIDGIQRFRFFKQLKVLNLEGNPIAMKEDFCLSHYIAAVLPNLQYYSYAAFDDEVREYAKETFARELRVIEHREEMEIMEREARAKEEADAKQLASSFVEHLNEHQLYESLWEEDDDGRILMMVGQKAQFLADDYDKEMYNITQQIYKLGLEKYNDRQTEIDDFMICLIEGKEEIQNLGRGIVEEFLEYKGKVFKQATILVRLLEMRTLRGEDEESPESLVLADDFDVIKMQFDEALNSIWTTLMSQELHLHESVEEATTVFQRNIQDMMSKFVEQCQTYFGQLRDICVHFADNLNEVVGQYIANKLALQDFEDVPLELRQCMEDRDAIVNLVAGMKDTHVQVVDEREDLLIKRGKAFIDNMVENVTRDELERNRKKILEINAFLEIMMDSLTALQGDIREEILNEEGG